MAYTLEVPWHQLQKQLFAALKKKKEAWERDCSVCAGLIKAEYLQNRKHVSDNSICKRCRLLPKVGGNGNIVFGIKAAGSKRKELEGESISVLYPHSMK